MLKKNPLCNVRLNNFLFSWWLGALQSHGEVLSGCVQPVVPAYCSLLNQKLRNYSTAADNTAPPRWVSLEPELDEALVPRKLSVSPLESWLSVRYSLPPLMESAQPKEEVEVLEEKVLPPVSVPVFEDGEGSVTPLSCKNVLEIRRRKMNRHKYRKLQKRTKFLRRRVMESRGKRKQVIVFSLMIRSQDRHSICNFQQSEIHCNVKYFNNKQSLIIGHLLTVLH